MYDNKQSVGKWKRALIAAALAACMAIALPGWTVGSAEAAPDLAEKSCTLTVTRSGKNQEQGDVVIDLYKVAGVSEKTGYDAYELTLAAPYNTTAIQSAFTKAQKPGENESANELYRKMAQEVAKVALGQNEGTTKQTPISADITGNSSEAKKAVFNELDPGMYLVIARDVHLTDPAKYITTVGEGESAQLATMAYNNQYVYTYLPELISLPMRADGNGGTPVGSFNTADRTDWISNVTVSLKSEAELKHASLEITKNLDKAPESNDYCVFRVTATLNGETLYDQYVSVNFGNDGDGNEENDGATTKTVVLENLIPVGATVTVDEVYDGAAYNISNSDSKTKVITSEADEETTGVDGTVTRTVKNKVSFTNNNDPKSNGVGGAITNNFKYSDSWGGSNDRGLDFNSVNQNT